ncbi:nuclear transport factor 2 family protein [Rhodococcus sp. KBS0724]|uniref:Rv0361 family membrane protein n=1 Tax=Rhodococcus sp. KBS0724 TaxID=1179674 RepID=UPI0021B0D106|nr:nuclear transport factor 2 family protein [Rhodococcus sp. KBS0724]
MPDSNDDNSTKRTPESSTPTEPATVAMPKAQPSPEPATVAIPRTPQPMPQQAMSQPKQQPVRAAPQRVGVAAGIPPHQPLPTRIEPAEPEPTKRGGKGWYIAAGAAAVAIVAVIGVALYVSSESSSGSNSPEAQVQTAISTYVDALASGDIAALRTATCGSLADYYQSVPDDAFAQVHQNAVTQKTIPQVSAVDAVRITDDTAIAQVEASIPATGERSWRTFDLERQDGTWKVCDPSQTG